MVVYLSVHVGWGLLLRDPDAGRRRRPGLPLPGPAARAGIWRFAGRFLLSTNLSVLNPFQLAQIIAQLLGQIVVTLRVWRRTPTAESYRQRARYRLPVRDEWLVFKGGVTPATSHSWGLLAQRYAYDLVRAAADGRRDEGAGDRLQDYRCYGAAVVAAADGTVVSVRDGVRDGPWPGTGWVDFLCRDFRGNWVVVRHAEHEYGFYAHLIPGSIMVAPGDHVEAGTRLGRCGNSGHSTEPHLHFQLQDRPGFFLSMGLPVRFDDVVVEGRAVSEGVYLIGGARVHPAAG